MYFRYTSHSEFNNSMDNIVYKDENTNTASGLRLLRTEMFTESGGKYVKFNHWKKFIIWPTVRWY